MNIGHSVTEWDKLSLINYIFWYTVQKFPTNLEMIERYSISNNNKKTDMQTLNTRISDYGIYKL